MQDDPQNPQEEQVPDEGQTGFVAGVERTPEVDQELREFGIDPDNPEEKKEEKVTPEAPIETQPTTPKEEPAAPVEEKTDETEVEISEDQAQKLIEEQTGEKKQVDEEYPWEKENREPTQREVLDYVAAKSADIAEQRRIDAQKEQETKQTQQLEEYKTLWKDNIDFLEKNNYIPKSAEGHFTDPKDAGNKARAILHEQAVLHNELDLEKVYWRYAKPIIDGKQPPGANAPIATTVNADTEKPSDDDDYFYDEVHGKDPSRDFDTLEIEAK